MELQTSPLGKARGWGELLRSAAAAGQRCGQAWEDLGHRPVLWQHVNMPWRWPKAGQTTVSKKAGGNAPAMRAGARRSRHGGQLASWAVLRESVAVSPSSQRESLLIVFEPALGVLVSIDEADELGVFEVPTLLLVVADCVVLSVGNPGSSRCAPPA
ncbi:MAG TPA: hypothetical protein VEZ89_14385 [Rubrivivax sp.]|nr:hypothetical protein [Rubrivivax sp.]